jgi:hypothetical protein
MTVNFPIFSHSLSFTQNIKDIKIMIFSYGIFVCRLICWHFYCFSLLFRRFNKHEYKNNTLEYNINEILVFTKKMSPASG